VQKSPRYITAEWRKALFAAAAENCGFTSRSTLERGHLAFRFLSTGAVSMMSPSDDILMTRIFGFSGIVFIVNLKLYHLLRGPSADGRGRAHFAIDYRVLFGY